MIGLVGKLGKASCRDHNSQNNHKHKRFGQRNVHCVAESTPCTCHVVHGVHGLSYTLNACTTESKVNQLSAHSFTALTENA